MHPQAASDATDSPAPATLSTPQGPPRGADDVHARANPRDRVRKEGKAATATESGSRQAGGANARLSQRSDVEAGSPVVAPEPEARAPAGGGCSREGPLEDFVVEDRRGGRGKAATDGPGPCPRGGGEATRDPPGDSDSEEGEAKSTGHGDVHGSWCCLSCGNCRLLWPWRDGWHIMAPAGGTGAGSGSSGGVAGGSSSSPRASWALSASSLFGQGTMVRAVSLIFAWYFFSMSLSLYNKFLIGEKHAHFPAPLLMTTFHFLFQYLLSSFLLNCVCPSWAPPTRLSCRDYNLRIIPTAMATALDIGLSNLSLAFITLTFYTMCKSSAPVFLLLFAFLFRLEALSMRLLGVMIVISVGVFFTVAGETHFQLLGFLLVMGSSLTSGLRWVLIQVLLQKEKLGLTNPLVTLSYLTPVMALLCAVFSLLHEPWFMLHKTPFFDTWPHALHSVLIMTLGGVLAFFMILAEFLLVLETSAVTFSVAGTVKEGATILVSHFVFGDRFTRINLIGIFVILLGVSLFNMYRLGRHRNEQRDIKVVGSGSNGRSGEETIAFSDDHQRLLCPTSIDNEHMQPAPSPRASGASLSGGSPGIHLDAPHVILATSMGHQQQRLLSPTALGPTPPLRSIELVQRPSHQGGQTDA